jgi:hypothetical protein
MAIKIIKKVKDLMGITDVRVRQMIGLADLRRDPCFMKPWVRNDWGGGEGDCCRR